MHLFVLVAMGVALAACSKSEGPETAGTAATATAAAAKPVEAVSATVAAMSADQLRESASSALREQRLYAPAGNNAMEYYLALRDKAPSDPAVASALTDLMPYALIATEQSIQREDFTEAQRLYALMEKTDKTAPALPRLKQTIAQQQQAVAARAEQEKVQGEEDAKRKAELEKTRAAQQLASQQAAAKQLADQQAAQQEADRKAAADKEAAAQREAAQRAAAASAPAESAPARPAPSAGGLRAVSTPAPRYPAEAARRQLSGEVRLEITVGTDGSVTAARVVDANPPRVFDREALTAVKRWKFAPLDAPVTTTRTISFRPGT
ncbi:energy transducer TonB [Lysobacter sp. A6]|uniref:Protein TonB n=1 Tax=Noviluteimonas lactosilytica TaxID=2888523 RepID=A0ABS8JHS4_9GAMM|nr:energy transducer TonB [Lysobacter lactosilyticus]MCC8363075.1 energy transducer TonB [Lysobacter lactosilyticus]